MDTGPRGLELDIYIYIYTHNKVYIYTLFGNVLYVIITLEESSFAKLLKAVIWSVRIFCNRKSLINMIYFLSHAATT